MNADMVLLNGRIITMDDRLRSAQALAVAAGRILLVGGDAAVRETIGPTTKVIDLAGRAVAPGFIDAHCHPYYYGRSLRWIDSRPDTTHHLSQIVAAVQAEAAKREQGQWIQGWGYDDVRLPPRNAITRHDLDPVSPHHPVCLTRMCGHVITVNSLALALAGVTRETPDPPGGQIDRDAQGEPTGVLRETARDLVHDIIPPETAEEVESAIVEAFRRYVTAGITGVHDALVDEKTMGAYMRLHQRGDLALRVYMMFQPQVLDFLMAAELPTGFGDPWLQVGPLKILLDGGIGARTAAQTEAYEHEPDNRGIMWMEQDALDDLVLRAHQAGFQVATHTIGNRAVEAVLTAYRRALNRLPRPDHRLRIEHLSLPLGDQVERVASMGIVVGTQPVFIYEAADTYITNLGRTRGEQVLPFRKLLDAGVPLAGSSDSPVASYVPMLSIQAAVTRRTQTGGIVGIGQEVTVAEALHMYTLGGAYASREEQIKGSLVPGKLADLVVLDRDPFDVPADELSEIAVDMTVIGGEVAYQRMAA